MDNAEIIQNVEAADQGPPASPTAAEDRMMELETIVVTIIKMYKGGAPGRGRLDCMIFRFTPNGQRQAVGRELQLRMGMAYPRKTGSRP